MELRTKIVLGSIGVGVLAFALGVWRDSQHRLAMSCDERRSEHPQTSCTDYYRDEVEISCNPSTVLKDPCPRTGARGGCRYKTHITWHYEDTDAGDGWHCSDDEKLVPADWKEPED